MKAVYGLYDDGHAAQQAFNRLRAAGVPPADITVLTAQPMEEFEFGNLDKATYMWWFACLGGLIGMTLAFGLAYLTEHSWPMNVGGLPVFAWWPNLIIIFELTMLGAITATTLTLIITGLLPTRGRTLYDPEVTDGKILIGVENPSDSAVPELERSLAAPPGARVKRAP
jgi:hypothetical protein